MDFEWSIKRDVWGSVVKKLRQVRNVNPLAAWLHRKGSDYGQILIQTATHYFKQSSRLNNDATYHAYQNNAPLVSAVSQITKIDYSGDFPPRIEAPQSKFYMTYTL